MAYGIAQARKKEMTQPMPPAPALIIHDNHDAAGSLALVPGMPGHTTGTAHDGSEAIEAAAVSHPDTVLPDIGMRN